MAEQECLTLPLMVERCAVGIIESRKRSKGHAKATLDEGKNLVVIVDIVRGFPSAFIILQSLPLNKVIHFVANHALSKNPIDLEIVQRKRPAKITRA